MSILLYVILAIAAVVFVVVGLFYLVKGFFVLLGWFLRLLPTLIRAAIYLVIFAVIWSMLKDRFALPRLPGLVYLLLYFVILGLILARRYSKHGYIFKTSSGGYTSYVLNTKSKVIHERYSDSAETISPQHRKDVSSWEAHDLVNNREKYRFKK